MDIYCSVIGQKLRIDTPLRHYPQNSDDFVRFLFTLSSDWDGLMTYAQFRQGDKHSEVYLTDVTIEHGESTVTYKAATLPDWLQPGLASMLLYGTGRETVIGTTNYVVICIDATGYRGIAKTSDMDETLYQQIINRIIQLEAIIGSQSATVADATKESKGVVQIGDGLEVENGLLSIDTSTIADRAYADGKATAAENTAKAYADSKAADAVSSAASYADEQAAAAETAAKSYATSKAADAVSSAESYADEQAAAAESAAKTYADGKTQNATENSKGVVQIGNGLSVSNGVVAVDTSRIASMEALQAEASRIEALVGSPLTAATAEEMTDTDRVYVYVGTTTAELTQGNWYYHNGSAWVSGGVYNSAALNTDATLSQSGQAADAAAAGSAIAKVDRHVRLTDAAIQSLTADVIDTITVENIYTHVSGMTDGKYYAVKLTLNNNEGHITFGLSTSQSAGTTKLFFADDEKMSAGDYWYIFKFVNDDAKYFRVFAGNSTYPSSTVTVYQLVTDKTAADIAALIATEKSDIYKVYNSVRGATALIRGAVAGTHTNISALDNCEYYILQLTLNTACDNLTVALTAEETGGADEYLESGALLPAGIYLYLIRKKAAVNYVRMRDDPQDSASYPDAYLRVFHVMNNPKIQLNTQMLSNVLKALCAESHIETAITDVYTDISRLRSGHAYILKLTLAQECNDLMISMASDDEASYITQTLVPEQPMPAGDHWFIFDKTGDARYLRLYSANSYPAGRIQIYGCNTEVNVNERNALGNTYAVAVLQRENLLRNMHRYSGASEHWYGAEWTEGVAGVTAINSAGDADLHTTLPIQSKMRRCVVKNGKVAYYLSASNSAYKEDGVTPALLDGTDGDVCVEIPEFFFRFDESAVNDKRHIQLKISEQALDGFAFSPKYYVGAYEATIDRANNVLASVCTTTFAVDTEEIITEHLERGISYIKADTGDSHGMQPVAEITGYTPNAANYRGGNNNSAYDSVSSADDINYWHNHLGRPIAEMNKDDMESLSDIRGGKFTYLYDAHKALWILSTVEYKTKNIQDDVAGLGHGATTMPNYDAFKQWCINETESILPCGVTNSLGNASGAVYMLAKKVPVSVSGFYPDANPDTFDRADVWVPCVSYRGVEHYWGHLYKTLAQLLIVAKATGNKVNGKDVNNVQYYYNNNPYRQDTTDIEPITVDGVATHTVEIAGYVYGMEGHILPNASNVTGRYVSGTDYCDCVEIYNRSDMPYQADVNGSLINLNFSGRNMIVSAFPPDGKNEKVRNSNGTRITYVGIRI